MEGVGEGGVEGAWGGWGGRGVGEGGRWEGGVEGGRVEWKVGGWGGRGWGDGGVEEGWVRVLLLATHCTMLNTATPTGTTLSTLHSCRRISRSRRAHRALRKGPTLRRRLARSLRCRTEAKCMTGTSARRLVSVLALVPMALASFAAFWAILPEFPLSPSPFPLAGDSAGTSATTDYQPPCE